MDHYKERYHQVLLELNRSKAREAQLIHENQMIHSSLSAISEAATPTEIFDQLVSGLKKFIQFRHAIVISRTPTTPFTTLLSTDKTLFALNEWPAHHKFKRALQGETSLVFDNSYLPYLSRSKTTQNCRVLLTGVSSTASESIIFLVDSPKQRFDTSKRDALHRLKPLFERAMQDFDYKMRLQTMVEQRTVALNEAKLEAERADKAKSEFLATMGHELRTPLNSILGILDVLKVENQDSRLLQLASSMEDSSELLLQLINDLLDSTKLDKGTLSVEFNSVNISDVVTNITNHFQPILHQKGVELHLRVDEQTPTSFVTDKVRLQQVLFNIVGNAAKFTSKGSVKLQIYPIQNCIAFSIVDTGVGISDQDVGTIFRPFGQADNSMTRQHEGTGLGLSISKQLVELLGGDISVESEVGSGSNFVILLPNKQAFDDVPGERSGQMHSEKTHGRAQLMVVDDSQSNRMLIKLMSEKLNIECTEAASGYEAIQLIQENGMSAYDLILMDLSMPKMDGVATTQELNTMGVNAPIIALTAHSDAGHRERCAQVNMKGFITKPVRLSKIQETMKEFGLLD